MSATKRSSSSEPVTFPKKRKTVQINNKNACTEEEKKGEGVLVLPRLSIDGHVLLEPGKSKTVAVANPCPCCRATGYYPVKLLYKCDPSGSLEVYRIPFDEEHSIEGHKKKCGVFSGTALCCCHPPSYQDPEELTMDEALSLVEGTRHLSKAKEASVAHLAAEIRARRHDKEPESLPVLDPTLRN